MALTCSNDRCPLSRRGLLEYYQGNKRIFEKYGTPTTQIAGNDRDILVRTEIANHYKSLCDTAIWTGIPKCLNCVSLTDIEYPPTSIRGWSRYEHLISTKDSKKARSKGKDLQLGLGKGNKPVHGVDLPVWQRHEIDGSTTTLRFWHIGDHLSNSIKTYCSLQHGVAGLIALHKKHLKLRKAGSAESSSTTGKLLMFRDYSPEILDEANQVISRSGITIDDDAVEPQVTAGKRGRSDQKSTSTGLAASGTSISSEAVSAPTATYIGMEEDDESNARPSRLPKLGE
ncbi:uncharacterized protein L201_006502 [Kwoniella dendrophila CBS 6074]|uniref:Uncharacterized protein n=1 Tax=Kwoniella dendrophila CBS 6074 TaxID=1295534 RepID=A0AAX4K1F6_9TREE